MQTLQLTITGQGAGSLAALRSALDYDVLTTRREDPPREFPPEVDVLTAVLEVQADTNDGARAHIIVLIREALHGAQYEFTLS
jgi:hypothetical protein